MVSSIKSLQTKGFVNVAYPQDIREKVLEATRLWREFCALPVDVRKSLPYSNASAGVGYEIKDGSGPQGDRKANLDVTSGSGPWLTQHAASIGNDVARTFIKLAIDLVKVIKPLILSFAEQVETEFGIPGFAQEVADSEDSFFIRFIHYPKGGEAKAHVDQSGFTLHLFESQGGLQYRSHDGVWHDMPVSTNDTVIIPDMQLQLVSEGKLRATWHRVMPRDVNQERFSAVCFIQFRNIAKYNKEVWGRLQEVIEGAFDTMSHEEFRKRFK